MINSLNRMIYYYSKTGRHMHFILFVKINNLTDSYTVNIVKSAFAICRIEIDIYRVNAILYQYCCHSNIDTVYNVNFKDVLQSRRC